MKKLIKQFIFLLIYLTGLAYLYRLMSQKRGRIIVYHRFTSPQAKSNLEVSIERLKKQLAYLNKVYHLVTLKELFTPLNKGFDKVGGFNNQLPSLIKSHRQATLCFTKFTNLPKAGVVVTIDDGHQGIKNAFPYFKQYQVMPTLFLTYNLVGEKEYLTWQQVSDLLKQGLDIQSHTLSHPQLSKISLDKAKEEIIASRVKLAQKLKKQVDFFAYPYGKSWDYKKEHIKLVKEAGYKAAFSIEEGTIGPADDKFQLKRIVVFDEPMFMFKVRISGVVDDFMNKLMRSH